MVNTKKIYGLSSNEALTQKSLGLSNTNIDTKNPSYLQIFIRNTFNIINISLTPLLVALFLFGVYRDVFVLVFVILTSAIGETLEEISVKKRLENLKDKFKSTAKVFRDGEIKEIISGDIVQNDLILAEEGDTIIADGEIIDCEYLQIDESSLTGESDYIQKNRDEKVLSGSFVVTGKCIYKVKGIGQENYLNKLSKESTKFEKKQSALERNTTKIVYIFTLIGFASSALNFIVAKINNEEIKNILIGITSIMGNTTPQMLIIILLITFIVSVTKLAEKGILIQKRGAIDDLAGIDVICMDKTGTITTNDMKVVEDFYYNCSKIKLKEFLSSTYKKIYGINKTAKTVFNYLKLKEENFDPKKHFNQVPFTSKQKYSFIEYGSTSVAMGAFSELSHFLKKTDQDLAKSKINEFENKGFRVMFGIITKEKIINNKTRVYTDKFFVLAIEESLNPGIKKILNKLNSQNIKIKIISGDSLRSVQRITQKIGINSDKVIDLSKFNGDINDLVDETIVFARAVPNDKSEIVKAIKKRGLKVSMIGDGVNDILGLKNSDVSIAMESGAKVARDTSDIVLLNNDYRKIPDIFYEGDNIILNIKLTAKIYFAKAIAYSSIAFFFTFFLKSFIPINPTSTLISSFLGSSLVSYLLTFSRQEVDDQRVFMKDIVLSSIPTGLLNGIVIIFIYLANRNTLNNLELNTAMILGILGTGIVYTLFILWNSGKIIKNVFFILLILASGLSTGILMTVLPVWQVVNFYDQIFLILLVGLGTILVHFIIRLSNMMTINSKQIYKASLLIPSLLFILALIFPSRNYFAVSPIPIASIFTVILGVGIYAILIIAIHKFFINPFMEYDLKGKDKAVK